MLARVKATMCSVARVDSRLLRRWKSDAKRTLSEWRWRKWLSSRRKKRFEAIFGKWVLTYTRTRVTSRLPDFEMSQRYSVLGADEASVAIVRFGERQIKNPRRYDPCLLQLAKECSPKQRIEHIHFSGNHYWVSLGSNREFFRRLE